MINSLLRSWADNREAVPTGCGAKLPHGRAAPVAAANWHKPAECHEDEEERSETTSCSERVARVLLEHGAGSDDHELTGDRPGASLPHGARLEVRVGAVSIGALQYVDDAATPCPKAGRRILGAQPSACRRYASRFKAAFNYGSWKHWKTACMPMYCSPWHEEGELACAIVREHICGVLMDTHLSFTSLLETTIAAANSAFEVMLRRATAGVFSFLTISSQVTEAKCCTCT